MLLVIDANILFSALIKDSKTAELLLFDKLELIAPEKIFLEFKKYKNEILSKTHRDDKEFLLTLSVFKDKIKIIPESEIKSFLEKANSISVDPNDIQYFAVALKFNCPIWSNDIHFEKQSLIKVFTTEELAEELGL